MQTSTLEPKLLDTTTTFLKESDEGLKVIRGSRQMSKTPYGICNIHQVLVQHVVSTFHFISWLYNCIVLFLLLLLGMKQHLRQLNGTSCLPSAPSTQDLYVQKFWNSVEVLITKSGPGLKISTEYELQHL